jgi:hypothetical protein
VSDGAGGMVVLRCKDRDLLYATVRNMLQAKMGGRNGTSGKTVDFQHKSDMLFAQLRKGNPRDGLTGQMLVCAPREDVLKPLRALTDRQWKMGWKTELG